MMSRKLLPLEHEEYVETDPEFGTTIRRTVFKRGIIEAEAIEYDDVFVGLSALAREDMGENFKGLLMRARSVLHNAQLPTDEDEEGWWKIIEERTEILSPERFAMTLIRTVNATLRKNFDEDALKRIWYLTRAAHDFELATGGINEAAVSAHQAEKARRKGPEVLANKGKRIEMIVREVATAYWKRVPLHRKNVAQTAIGISIELKVRLEAEGFKSIGLSRIRDYLCNVRDSAEQQR
jgi:hypothetical protein